MMSEQQQELASLFVAGALPPDEARAFELQLAADAQLRQLVGGLRNAAGALALALPAPRLDPALKHKIMGRISETPRFPLTSKHLAEAGRKAGEPGGWKELPIRGAWIKLLAVERERGYAVALGRIEPGVLYPAHTHEGPEELFILTGDLHIGDQHLHAGDFSHAEAGSAHGVNYSDEGCTLLAVLPAEHELVQFALAGA